MELSEELKILRNENENLKKLLEDCTAEKIALDQLFVETLKSFLQIKKQMIIDQSNMEKIKVEIESIKKEKADIEHSLSLVCANANCGG